MLPPALLAVRCVMEFSTLGFIDIETTGHDPQRRARPCSACSGKILLELWHEITELACVFARTPGLEVVGEFKTLVKPKYPERCDPETIPITNFPERWKSGEWDGAPSLDEAIRQMLCECHKHSGGEAVVVPEVVIPGGQNFFFDWSFLSVGFSMLGITDEEYTRYIHYKRFDVASMAIQELWDPRTPLDMSQFSLRSGLLQEALGIEPEPKPHYAINGARQAHWTFRKLSERKLVRFSAS